MKTLTREKKNGMLPSAFTVIKSKSNITELKITSNSTKGLLCFLSHITGG